MDGFILDRGFQVLNTAYPALRSLVDLDALDLKAFDPAVDMTSTASGSRSSTRSSAPVAQRPRSTSPSAAFIAHRLSTVRRADLILVLQDGEIVERGTHQELMGRRGIYYEIYELQLRPQAEMLLDAAEAEDKRGEG